MSVVLPTPALPITRTLLPVAGSDACFEFGEAGENREFGENNKAGESEEDEKFELGRFDLEKTLLSSIDCLSCCCADTTSMLSMLSSIFRVDRCLSPIDPFSPLISLCSSPLIMLNLT